MNRKQRRQMARIEPTAAAPTAPSPGTKAAGMPGHLPPGVIKSRAEELRLISEEKKRSFAARFVGRELPVLVQGESVGGRATGLSRNYLSVSFAAPSDSRGEEIPVRITGVNDDGSCLGEPVG